MSELAADGVPVAVTCRVLNIARQPYYRWRARPVTETELEQAYRADALFNAHRDDPEFGYRFLADEARDAGQQHPVRQLQTPRPSASSVRDLRTTSPRHDRHQFAALPWLQTGERDDPLRPRRGDDHPHMINYRLHRRSAPTLIYETSLRPRSCGDLAEFLDIFAALDEQTVTVPGTEAAALIAPGLAGSLSAVHNQRTLLATRIEELLEAHPLSKVLTSLPGIGVRTAARILVDVGDASSFPTSGHLAAYAGLAPATRTSGSSIRGEHPSQRGNKQLKRAFYLSAFASLREPASRAYYGRKRAEGKHHVAALTCLARRRIDVLYAMLRDGTLYQPPPVTTST